MQLALLGLQASCDLQRLGGLDVIDLQRGVADAEALLQDVCETPAGRMTVTVT